MTTKPKPEPKLTDDERAQRFKDMAREVGASEKLEDFDKAFARIARVTPNPPNES